MTTPQLPLPTGRKGPWRDNAISPECAYFTRKECLQAVGLPLGLLGSPNPPHPELYTLAQNQGIPSEYVQDEQFLTWYMLRYILSGNVLPSDIYVGRNGMYFFNCWIARKTFLITHPRCVHHIREMLR